MENYPKWGDMIYDIGDYGVKHSQPERLVTVADAGEAVVPGDLRGKYYRAVAMVLKKERLEEAETLLREYVEKAPVRSNYPRRGSAHEWLGRVDADGDQTQGALGGMGAAGGLGPGNTQPTGAVEWLMG